MKCLMVFCVTIFLLLIYKTLFATNTENPCVFPKDTDLLWYKFCNDFFMLCAPTLLLNYSKNEKLKLTVQVMLLDNLQ